MLESSIQRARKEGKFDEGIVDVKGTAISLAKPPQVCPLPLHPAPLGHVVHTNWMLLHETNDYDKDAVDLKGNAISFAKRTLANPCLFPLST